MAHYNDCSEVHQNWYLWMYQESLWVMHRLHRIFITTNAVLLWTILLSLLQMKYILFVGENAASTDNIKMRQAIQKKIRLCIRGRNRFWHSSPGKGAGWLAESNLIRVNNFHPTRLPQQRYRYKSGRSVIGTVKYFPMKWGGNLNIFLRSDVLYNDFTGFVWIGIQPVSLDLYSCFPAERSVSIFQQRVVLKVTLSATIGWLWTSMKIIAFWSVC